MLMLKYCHEAPPARPQLRKLLPALIISGVAVIGIVVFSLSHAATPYISAEPENGTITSPAQNVSDSSASGSQAVQFKSSDSGGGTTLFGWQKTPANTGLASVGMSCDSLPVYTGSNFVPAGTTITGKRITSGLTLSAGNITIDKSCFKPGPGDAGGGFPFVTTTNYNICDNNGCQTAQGPATISNSEFDGSLLAIKDAAQSACAQGSINLINNYCRHWGSGFAIFNSGNTYDVTIDGNVVDDMVAWGDAATTGTHSDGFTIRDFNISSHPNRKATVTNNYINTANNNATGSFFIQDTFSSGIGNVYASGNLLKGNGWEMSGAKNSAPVTNINITDNRFGGTTDGGYGACASPNFTWNFTGNYINDPTKPDNKGAVVNC
jgi:hypothetical protein